MRAGGGGGECPGFLVLVSEGETLCVVAAPNIIKDVRFFGELAPPTRARALGCGVREGRFSLRFVSGYYTPDYVGGAGRGV